MASTKLGDVLLRGVASSGGAVLLGRLLTFAQFALVARWLSKDDFGVVGLARSVVMIAGVLALQGMATASVRFVASSLARDGGGQARSAVVRAVLMVAGGVGLAAAALTWMFHGAWGLHPDTRESLAPHVGLVLLWAVAHPFAELLVAVLLGRGWIGTAAFLRHPAVPLGVTLFVASAWTLKLDEVLPPLAWVLGAFAGSHVLRGLIATACVLPWWRRLPRGAPLRWRVLVGTGWSLGAQTWLFTVANQGLVWWLSRVAGSEDVARLVASLQLVSVVSFPLLVLSHVASPLIARLHAAGEAGRIERLVRSSATAASVVGGGAGAVLFAVAPLALAWLYGEDYRGDAPVLRVLVVGEVLRVSLGFGGLVLAMTGGHVVRLANGTMATCLAWLTALWSVPRWGAEGGAVAYVVFLGAMLVGNWVAVRRRAGVWVHPWWRLGELRGMAHEVLRVVRRAGRRERES